MYTCSCYLEAVYRIQGKETCTQQACKWILPSFSKNVEYLPIADIDFTSASNKKRKLDSVIDSTDASSSMKVNHVDVRSKNLPSYEEMNCFYERLSKSKSKPAILSLVDPYSDNYVPSSSLPECPFPLTALHKPEYENLSYSELLEVCEGVEVSITESESIAIQKITVSQFKSKSWFRYRAGRITASRIKAVCHTNPSHPSQSLIKSICYPDQFCFKTKATTWGCTHEKAARRWYINNVKKKHGNFILQDSGLVINPQWSYIGATPDGKVSCDCCGHGVVEIKCPYCHRNESIQHSMDDKNFCLKNNLGDIHLDTSHAYYYQVQTQMFVCDVEYCDFVVCTFSAEDNMHIERLSKNFTFWSDRLSKAEIFIRTCILPELLGKWYTRPIVPNTRACADSEQANAKEGEATSKELEYCYCHGPDEGPMIGCDNINCEVQWFHMKCLKITSAPRGKWYCPDCRKLPEFLTSKKKRKETI